MDEEDNGHPGLLDDDPALDYILYKVNGEEWAAHLGDAC